MTDEELKKKIVEIVLNVEWTGCLGYTYHLSGGMSAASAIADALILAGIGDTKAAVREFAGVLRDKISREHSLGTKGYIVGFKEMKERALADVDALVKEVCGGDESNDDRLR